MNEISSVLRRDVSRETYDDLKRFAVLLMSENSKQNLVSKASELDLWNRHIVDSAQLLRFASPGQSWTDIGTGPGLPGLVLAILDPGKMILVEPRRRRVEFMEAVASAFRLANVMIVHGKSDATRSKTDLITARAVASPAELFAITSHLRHAGTTYVLPRGRTAQSELAELEDTWQGEFTLHRSLTSDDASILVARNVRRKGPR